MAVDNWFQTWQPPTNLVADQNVFTPEHMKNYSSLLHEKNGKHGGNPADMLPFFLSLGLLAPPSVKNKNAVSTKTYDSDAEDFSFDGFGEKTQLNDRYGDEELSTGPFKTKYAWKQLDFKYRTPQEREAALALGDFVPENNLPLGIEVWKDRLFVTMPKWKNGVPATLSVLPRDSKELSPALVPYPNWDWHRTESCAGLTSVFRIQADDCGRLWVLDSGQINVTVKPIQVCPPAIYVFDLKTDSLILRYPLPQDFIKQDSLYSNIVVDNRDGDCSNVHAYLTDVWRYGLVVFSLKKLKSWRVTDHLFQPEPLAAAYKLHDLEFEWTDGIFGLSLGPWNKQIEDRILYFHPMSSFREFYVRTNVICNETGWDKVKDAFKLMGQSRGKSGQVSASAIDRQGVMFYNLVTRDSVGCWDSRKPYKRSNLGVVAKHNENLLFPNDLKVDKEEKQSVWVISNKLPFFLYSNLDKNQYNFRIMSAYTEDAVKGTICDPKFAYSDSFTHFAGEEDCY